MKKAEAYLNKARGPNLFELTGICTGRAHWFWCAPRLFPTSFHPDDDMMIVVRPAFFEVVPPGTV